MFNSRKRSILLHTGPHTQDRYPWDWKTTRQHPWDCHTTNEDEHHTPNLPTHREKGRRDVQGKRFTPWQRRDRGAEKERQDEINGQEGEEKLEKRESK